MGERITAIREVINEHGDDGYDVVTTERTIKIRIDNGQSCCENWGYMSTPDDPASFVGADLLSVSTVDDDDIGQPDRVYDDGGGTLFVNVETSIGQLQLAVYNHHNGYYGHRASVSSDPPMDGASYEGIL